MKVLAGSWTPRSSACPVRGRRKTRSAPRKYRTAKGKKNWFCEMKLHIGVDGHTGLAHNAMVTSANVHDQTPPERLHADELDVYGDCAHAEQQEVIVEEAHAAKDCTNQCVRKTGDKAEELHRRRNREKSKVRAYVSTCSPSSSGCASLARCVTAGCIRTPRLHGTLAGQYLHDPRAVAGEDAPVKGNRG